MISEQSKETIDSLSFDELREEVLKDSSSRFQGEKFVYLLARFAKLKDEQRDLNIEKMLKYKVNILKQLKRLIELQKKQMA